MKKEFRELKSIDEARSIIWNLQLKTEIESVPLLPSLGRVLGGSVSAPMDVPGFSRASMDGYAVRARDTFGAVEDHPMRLASIGTILPGVKPKLEVGAEEAAEISTGAVVPRGADAVVMEEDTEREEGAVLVKKAVAPGENIMYAGGDVAEGETILRRGTLLTPREIGLLAALGLQRVDVHKRPVVAVISTGAELVPPGRRPRVGQIYDVNTFSLASAIVEACGEPRIYKPVKDDYEAMELVLEKASRECDLILSSGSTSVSALDMIYRVVELKGSILLHGIKIRPGKPTVVGLVHGKPFIGLPGYPVSALTIFRLFVAPLIKRAVGLSYGDEIETLRASMAVHVRTGNGRPWMLPVALLQEGERLLAYPVEKGSGATTSLTDADGYVEVPGNISYLAKDEEVQVRLFSSGIEPPEITGMSGFCPGLSILLDFMSSRVRWLTIGSRESLRRMADGIPDAVGLNLPLQEVEQADFPDATLIHGYKRSLGLIVARGNPHGIGSLLDLAGSGLRFANRGLNSGTRAILDSLLAEVARENGRTFEEVKGDIVGYASALKSHDSVAKAVSQRIVDAGFGLKCSAVKYGLDFIPVTMDEFYFIVNPRRSEKRGVVQFLELLKEDRLAQRLRDIPGYEVPKDMGGPILR